METNEKNRAGQKPRTGQPQRRKPTDGAQQRSDAPRRKPSSTAVKNKPGTTGKKRPAEPKRQRRSPALKRPTPDVIYTQPGPFNRNRFILYLVSAVAIVLALLFGMSIFFKVDTVTVTGNNKYTAWDIREASGIMDGENLLTISAPRISSNIRDALPYVNKVRVGIKLPDTVKIEIVELDVVYAVEASDTSWWLIRSDGVVTEKTNNADAGQYAKILGVQIADPEVGQQASAYQPQHTAEDGSTVPVTVLAGDQLQTALSIAQNLENNGMIGNIASVDVTSLTGLEFWYGQQYQVLLGDAMQLDYKIKFFLSALKHEQLGRYESGIVDVSFTLRPDEIVCTPFS